MAKTFKVNVKANLDAMSGSSQFVDVKEGATVIFRLAPPVREDGVLFYPVRQHWKFKDQDGHSIALANLGMHGNDETGTEDYIEELSKVLLAHGTETEKTIGKGIKGNTGYRAQGFEGKPIGGGKQKFDQKIKFLSTCKTVAEAAVQIIRTQQNLEEPTLDDPEGGQALLITRTGTGFNTKYQTERSGRVMDLNEIVPGWQDKLVEDIYDELSLKIYTRDMQKQIAQITYPELPWDKLEHEFGL